MAEFPKNGNPEWVHVSYESTGKQRKQVLVAKKVDGKTFHETLANVSAKITNQWAVEFAWQDLIKYMNISDKETYNKIFAWYVDLFIDNYDTKVASNVEWLFMSLWIKWNFHNSASNYLKSWLQNILAKIEMKPA